MPPLRIHFDAYLLLLALLAVGCTAQTITQYRDPKTGFVVDECIRDAAGWRGVFADIDQGNQYAECKTRAESRGLERVR